jgi:hypothetical protein
VVVSWDGPMSRLGPRAGSGRSRTPSKVEGRPSGGRRSSPHRVRIGGAGAIRPPDSRSLVRLEMRFRSVPVDVARILPRDEGSGFGLDHGARAEGALLERYYQTFIRFSPVCPQAGGLQGSILVKSSQSEEFQLDFRDPQLS